MAFRAKRSTSGGGFSGFSGFGGGSSNVLTVDQLLEVARLQGGAVGEVAEELAHPERSILSTIGNGFKNAFAGFVDVISVPSQIVAGALDPDVTVSEAIESNLRVSDVIFGESNPNATGYEKVGEFIVRTAVDILTDPLTYVTFGSARGLIGISSLPKIKVGKETAKILGVAEGSSKALSEQGFKLFKNGVAAQRNGLRSTFLKNERIKIVKDLKKAGKTFDEVEVQKAVKAIDDKTSDAIIESTLNKRLDRDFTKNAIANMVEKNPALVETMIDKGGIKFMGKSILSGQRIKATGRMIPGMSMLDNVTKPVRNTLGAMFSPNRSASGRIPDEFLQIEQKFSDLASARKNDFLRSAPRVFRELKITAAEADLMTAAIEANKLPSDPKLAELWKGLNGFEYDTSIIRSEVIAGARLGKSTFKKNLKSARAAGIPVTEQSNYVPHYLVDEQIKTVPFQRPPTTALKAAKQAKIAAFVDDEGTRLVGKADDLGLKKETDELFSVKPIKDAKGKVTNEAEAGKILTRERATIEEAKSLGVDFEDNALALMVANSLDTIKATTMKEFMVEAGKKAGVAAKNAPKGWRPVTVKGLEDVPLAFADFVTGVNKKQVKFGKGFKTITEQEELFFHPETAKRIEDFMGSVINDEATNKFLQQFDKLQNLWKASVTSIFPAFHGRNAVSNVFLHFLDIGIHSLNPANHIASARLLAQEAKFGKLSAAVAKGGKNAAKSADELFDLQNKVVMTDATGYQWSFGELRRVISENVVGFNPEIVGATDFLPTSGRMSAEIADGLYQTGKKAKAKKIIKQAIPLSQNFVGFKVGRRVGNIVEEQARILDFFVNLKKTGDVGHAARRTKQFLFDYQNLTKFEKTFMRRIIPFYTFSRKNLELQAKTLLRTPGRTAAEVRAITTLGDVISSGRLTDEEKDALPDWIKDGLFTLKSKDGSLVEVFGSLGTPIEQVFQQAQPNQLLGSVSPLLRVPAEQASGYSFFHGKGLSEVTNAAAFKSAPESVQDFIGYTKVTAQRSDGSEFTYHAALRPERMHLLLNLPPTGRVLSALKQMEAVDVSTQSKLLQQLVGVRPFAFDLEVEAQRREDELRKQIEQTLDHAGVGYSFERFIIPKDKKKGFDGF